jgi:hypothetical protein
MVVGATRNRASLGLLAGSSRAKVVMIPPDGKKTKKHHKNKPEAWARRVGVYICISRAAIPRMPYASGGPYKNVICVRRVAITMPYASRGLM